MNCRIITTGQMIVEDCGIYQKCYLPYSQPYHQVSTYRTNLLSLSHHHHINTMNISITANLTLLTASYVTPIHNYVSNGHVSHPTLVDFLLNPKTKTRVILLQMALINTTTRWHNGFQIRPICKCFIFFRIFSTLNDKKVSKV